MNRLYALLLPRFRLVEVAGLFMLFLAAISAYFLIEVYQSELPAHVAAELKTRSPNISIKGPISDRAVRDLEALGYPISQEIINLYNDNWWIWFGRTCRDVMFCAGSLTVMLSKILDYFNGKRRNAAQALQSEPKQGSERPELRQVVVDRNVVRRPALARAAADPKNELVLIDTFLVEAVKDKHKWDETLRRDFAALTPYADRLRLSVSASEILGIEIREGRAITRAELLPAEMQALLPVLLKVGVDGLKTDDAFRHRVESVLPALRAEQSPPEVPKLRTEKLVADFESLITNKTTSDLRSGRLRGDAKLGFVEDMASRLYEGARCPCPMPDSAFSRIFILKVWRALWWYEHNGIREADAAKLHNDDYDDDYIVIGSFFDETISDERRFKEADAALRRIIEFGPSGILAEAFADFVS